MSRYAKAITLNELKERLTKICENEDYNPYYILELIPQSDVKIKMDFENVIFPFDNECTNNGVNFYELNGFAIALCYGGGDWEVPIYFCLYYDDRDKLRLYIPTKGNLFNKYTKTAYNSEYDTELDPVKVWKSMPDDWKANPNLEVNDTCDFEFSDKYNEMIENYYNGDYYDIDAMLEDIKKRIVLKR